MGIKDSRIDCGREFDFGKTSADYARFRDIYPQIFYDKIADRGLCIVDQKVLDLGTGTGVLPRNMYHYGASWTGTDISCEQINEAKRTSDENGMKIDYIAVPAEKIDFPDETFDVITACQCFWYFDHEVLVTKLRKLLKKNGVLLILYMAWLPFEDKIAGESEKLVLKYSPKWSGAGETIHQISIPKCVLDEFDMIYHEEYPVDVPFTRESWHGRMKSCRGIGASLSEIELADWESEHLKFLNEMAPENFTVKHYAAMAELRLK